MEQLEYGVARQRRPWLVPVILLTVCLIGAAAWWGDRAWRDHGAEQVAAGVEDASLAVDSGSRRLAAIIDYVRPATSRPDLDPATRVSLTGLVGDARADAITRARQARASLASVRLAPWHDESRQRRDAALAEIDARISELQSSAGGSP